jgi:hypothetical protein
MLLMSMSALAQNVGINNPVPHSKSLLDLTSTDKGLLAPRMTQAQRLAMFAGADATAKGMLVYQTDNSQGFYYYDGAVWQNLNSNAGWGLTGNAGTNSTTNFIGTADNTEVVMKANNNEVMRIKPNQKVMLSNANAAPSYAYSRLSIADENGSNSDIGFRVAGNSYSQIVFDQSGGTLAAPAASASGNWSGVVVGRSYDGTAYGNTAAMILGVDSAVSAGKVRGNIQFQTSGGSQLEKMRITKDGKVGIGTNNPFSRLHVANNDSGFATSTHQNMHAAGWSGEWFRSNSGALAGHIGYGNASSPRWAGQVYAGSIAAVPFILTTADFERMRIDASGNVGIDTTAPKARLHVKSNSSVSWPQIIVEERDSNDFSRVSFANKGVNKYWTLAANSAAVDSNSRFNIYNSNTFDLFTLLGNGKVGLSNSSPVATLSMNNNIGQKLSIWQGATTCYGIGLQANTFQIHTAGVNDDIVFGYGSSGALTQSMKIKGTGMVGIGTSNPTSRLHIEGNEMSVPLRIQNNMNTSYSGIHFQSSAGALMGQGGYGNPGAATFANTMYYGSVASIPLLFTTGDAERVRVETNGNVGIGTPTPVSRLHVLSDGNMPMSIQNPLVNGYSGMHLLSNTGSVMGHFGYGNPAVGVFGDRVYAGSTSAVPFVLTANNAERIRIQPSGEVGINTNAPTADLEVNGFTKLGSDAPAIKVKKYTGTTPGSQGAQINFIHGLDAAKILQVSVVIEYSPGNYVSGGYTWTGGYESSVYYTGAAVFVCNRSANSANILSKPFKVLITYEE